MNREILFKAKGKVSNRWHIGFVTAIDTDEDICMISDGQSELICSKSTLCQFTGLTDKNGNKIWENDIVFVTDEEVDREMVNTGIGEIDFLEGLWYISGYVQNSLYDINKCYQIEVLGNIFDNAELLGKE